MNTLSRSVIGIGGWTTAIAVALVSLPVSDASPAGASGDGPSVRPACPAGWLDFKNPILGFQAHVPTDYWVRLRGGTMLTVEKQSEPTTMAFMMPLRPKAGAKAPEIAERFARFVAQSQPQFKAESVGPVGPDRVLSRFTSLVAGQAVEGRYCTLLGAGGTMAFIIGTAAPQGQLERELPTLQVIARSFGFEPPRGKWNPYQSPAGGFTMTLPAGWEVHSGDGQSGKDDIDWAARDPRKPLSRAFQACPRYCSPGLLQDPLHVIRGYRAAQFQSHQSIANAALSELSQNVRILKWEENRDLTALFRALNQQLAQLLSALQVGQTDITVYDVLAQAELDGRPVMVAFIAGIQTLAISGGFGGPLMDWRVTLRGWCAPAEEFVIDSPVLEKVCASMQLTPAFLNRIMQGNAQAAKKISETYEYMNQVDDQIRKSRWDTMDAIAEMNYDNLRDYGGYVNEKTGRIEQIAPEKLIKNRDGEHVSREEVERGVSPEDATVLRGAFSDDYMRGVHGRIEF